MIYKKFQIIETQILRIAVLAVLISCFVSINKVNAQTDSVPSLIFFKAQLLTADSLLPVPDAYIISKQMIWGTISDTNGFFDLYVGTKDTLLISSIGFKNILYFVNDTNDLLDYSDSLISIKLEKDTITLNEVLIRAFWDYETFKQMVINMRLPDDFHINTNNDDMILNRPLQPSVSGPVQALYNIFNHSARLRRKLIRNRKNYNKLMIQMGRPQDTIPLIPEHMQAIPH